MIEQDFVWPEGAKAAVSICYQRSPLHALRRLEALASRDVGATVFVQPTDLLETPRLWREGLAEGHEVGNASLHAMTYDGTLPHWTREMIQEDLAMSDQLLSEFQDHVSAFAVPGPNLLCEEGPYDDLLEGRYTWILTAAAGINHPVFSNPKSLLQISVTPETTSETLDALEDGIDRGAWCVMNFDLRTDVVRRFHDAFIEVVPHTVPGVLWRGVSEVGRIMAGFRENLTLH